MLDELFAEAWVNSSHRVLGLKLRPFCLWHRFQLEILDSPFLSGQPVTVFDLERAVQACRLSYPQVIKPKINMWSFRWRLASRSFQREGEKFFRYLNDYFAAPKFVAPVQKKHMTPSTNHPPPENLVIFSAIVALTGWSEEKIWMLPIGQAYWYAAAHWYQAGSELDFLTPEHLILQERIRKLQEQNKNGSERKLRR